MTFSFCVYNKFLGFIRYTFDSLFMIIFFLGNAFSPMMSIRAPLILESVDFYFIHMIAHFVFHIFLDISQSGHIAMPDDPRLVNKVSLFETVFYSPCCSQIPLKVQSYNLLGSFLSRPLFLFWV